MAEKTCPKCKTSVDTRGLKQHIDSKKCRVKQSRNKAIKRREFSVTYKKVIDDQIESANQRQGPLRVTNKGGRRGYQHHTEIEESTYVKAAAYASFFKKYMPGHSGAKDSKNKRVLRRVDQAEDLLLLSDEESDEPIIAKADCEEKTRKTKFKRWTPQEQVSYAVPSPFTMTGDGELRVKGTDLTLPPLSMVIIEQVRDYRLAAEVLEEGGVDLVQKIAQQARSLESILYDNNGRRFGTLIPADDLDQEFGEVDYDKVKAMFAAMKV